MSKPNPTSVFVSTLDPAQVLESIRASNLSITDKIRKVQELLQISLEENQLPSRYGSLSLFLKSFPILDAIYQTPTDLNTLIFYEQADRRLCMLLFEFYIDIIDQLDQQTIKVYRKLEKAGHLSQVLSQFTDSGYDRLKLFLLYGDNNQIQQSKHMQWLRLRVVAIECIAVLLMGLTFMYMLNPNIPDFQIIPYINSRMAARIGLTLLLFIELIMFLYASSIDFIMAGSQDRREYEKAYRKFYNFITNVEGIRKSIRNTLSSLIDDSHGLKIKSPYGTYITFNEIKEGILTHLNPIQRQKLFLLLGFKRSQAFLTDLNFMYWVMTDNIRKNGWLIVSLIITAYFTYVGILTTIVGTLFGGAFIGWITGALALFQPRIDQ